MESLAIAASVVVLSIIGIGLIACCLSLFGLRTAGGMVGVIAVAAGLWMGVTLPHAIVLWSIPLATGAWAVSRWANSSTHNG